MKKEEYLEQIQTSTGLTKKDIDLVLKTYWELLRNKLVSEKKVNIVNFGTFTVKTTKPHIIFSPVDGRSIKTKGINKIFFSSSKNLLAKIERPKDGND
jgi:nucleoid DNA-binding protein